MNKYEAFVGKVLDGRYKILELVGMGGMACVLKAQDLVMNRIVAIKILNDEYNGNEQAEARFIDESKAVAMLSNKNIVSVYDVAIYPDIKYIVMEYLDGITLREYLDNKGVIGWKEACIYTLKILRALEHAHSKGIIHRDIKPQNVILLKNGDIKVTDFGIAKLPNSVTDNTAEKAIGTVYYISPEQACGKTTDAYSDIYSVGVMLYEAVTGTLPFTAETPMEVAMMQVNDEPINPRDIVLDIPVGVSQIILKAMEKAPEERFQSAHTMAKAIEWVLRNPEVIFAMSALGASESPAGGSVVSIDMIDTAEIEPYDEEEIEEGVIPGKPAKKTKKGGKNAKKKKKSKTNRTMFPIVCGVAIPFLLVVVILAGFTIANFFQQISGGNDTVELIIPNLKEKNIDDALETLKTVEGYEYLDIEIIQEANNDKDNGEVLRTVPSSGTPKAVDENTNKLKLKIYVAESQFVTVPNLFGYSENSAKEILGKLKLKYEIKTTTNASNEYFEPKQVVNTEPAHGNTVRVGSTVTVTVYQRPASTLTAKMPNLVGCTEAEARKLAETYAKFKIGSISYQEVEGGNNTVILQSVTPGTRVNLSNNLVDIVIGKPLSNMVNVTGMSLAQAKMMIDFDPVLKEKNIQFRVDSSYEASESDRALIENIAANASDIFSCNLQLTTGTSCVSSWPESENAIIVFQSLKAGEPISQPNSMDGNIYIDVIVVNFVTGTPGLNGGDNSAPSDNSGTVSEVTP